MNNPYRVVQIGKLEDGRTVWGVEYKDYPKVAICSSWGTRQFAMSYMADLLGLTYDEYKAFCSKEQKVVTK